MCVLSQRDPILLWNEMKVSFQEPSSATCFWVPVESSNANSPSGFIPCRSAPGCPGPCPPAGRPSGLADYSVDRTRMGWNTRGPRCHSRDCAGGRQVRPFLSPSRIRNKVSRAASQSLRVSDPLVAHGDYLRKGPRGKNVVAVVKNRGDSQREQEIIEKGAFWGARDVSGEMQTSHLTPGIHRWALHDWVGIKLWQKERNGPSVQLSFLAMISSTNPFQI